MTDGFSPEAAPSRPGRVCPLHYRYEPGVLARKPDLEAETLYLAGELYGNPYALERLLDLVHAEAAARAVLALNGDFHRFDVSPCDFTAIDYFVMGHTALRGNVETEIAGNDDSVGCGCAYPDGVVTRISSRPAPRSLYATKIGAAHVEAVAVHYDSRRWIAAFLDSWPPGSPAHGSYFERLLHGPAYEISSAVRGGVVLHATADSIQARGGTH